MIIRFYWFVNYNCKLYNCKVWLNFTISGLLLTHHNKNVSYLSARKQNHKEQPNVIFDRDTRSDRGKITFLSTPTDENTVLLRAS